MRKCRFKIEFAFFQSLSRIISTTYFVKCRQTLLELNRPCRHSWVFDAILTSRQKREKLQRLYTNLMSNNFRKTAVFKKNIFIVN